MTITDSITTIAAVCLIQNKDMNTITDEANARLFSDSFIESIINNVIDFVYSLTNDDASDYLLRFAVNQLSVIALNNAMFEKELLKNWTWTDPFDKEKLQALITEKQHLPSSIAITKEDYLHSTMSTSRRC
jgi:hypothetical protein